MQFKDKINNKSNKSYSKTSVKTILMTKPLILNPNGQKTNKRQTIVGFGRKILKICLRAKTFLQMFKKKVSFTNSRTIILNIAEIHKSLVKKLTPDMLIFKIALKD